MTAGDAAGSTIEELASALDAVLGDAGAAADAELRLVLHALADAAEGLESILDTRPGALDPTVEIAVIELLHDVRDASADRVGLRLRAGLAVPRVVEALGDHHDPAGRDMMVAAAPLLVLLGALAVLPDESLGARFLDPTPDPDRPIELAMAAMVDDPGERSALRWAVYEGSLFLPVLGLGVRGAGDGDRSIRVQFLPVVVRGVPAICAFTSRERFEEHRRAAGVGDIPLIEVDGDELAGLCPPGHGLAIDPGWVLGCAFTEREVRALPHPVGLSAPDGALDVEPLGSAGRRSIDAALATIDDEAMADFGVAGVSLARLAGPAEPAGRVVIAVATSPDMPAERGVRRLADALIRRGVDGPIVVPATSALGQRVVSVDRRPTPGRAPSDGTGRQSPPAA